MDLKTPVSGRQFARMVGQSEGAVRKAVERSSIVAGVTADKKYIPEVASAEWGKPILPEFLEQKKSAPEKPKAKKAVLPKEKPEATTADEVVKEIMSEKTIRVSSADLESENEEEEISEIIGKPEAERKIAVMKAKMLQIALKEKQGLVVDRAKINSVLFAYGQETRIMIEGISNRVIDKILATETRHEAKRILDEEIHSTLVALADIPNRPI